MLEPINFNNSHLQVSPFQADDLDCNMAGEVYAVLSDERTLRFLPEKRLCCIEHAESWLKSALLNFYTGRNYVHFVRSKSSGRLLGIIDILSPKLVRDHYRLPFYPYFIEFYLKGDVQGRSVMSDILPTVIGHIRSQGIGNICAVINCKNKAAKKVLEKAGFVFCSHFDHLQDLYTYAA